MGRAPFQVLVLPYRLTGSGNWEFAIFHRADTQYWQGIAGGGEDDESPIEAARREAFEEAGISSHAPFLPLDTMTSIRVSWFGESHLWTEERFVIPEYAFGVETGNELAISAEHDEIRWLPFAEAQQLLRFDSNRTALWELNQRIRGLGPRDIPG